MKKNRFVRILMKALVFSLILVSIPSLFSNHSTAAASNEEYYAKFEKGIYVNEKIWPEAELPYRLYIPDNYDKNKSYPLLIYLCGMGQYGTDNESQFELFFLADELSTTYKNDCIILAPQCSMNDSWVQNFYGDISTVLAMTVRLVSALSLSCNIDPQRIYAAGHCTGGAGVWDLTYRFPEMCSAVIPVSGAFVSDFASKVKAPHIWAFYSDDYQPIPIAQVREMMQAVENAGNKNVRLTEVENNTHLGAWEYVRDHAGEVLQWLFSVRKSETVPSNNTADTPANTDPGAISQANQDGNTAPGGNASSAGNAGSNGNTNVTSDGKAASSGNAVQDALPNNESGLGALLDYDLVKNISLDDAIQVENSSKLAQIQNSYDGIQNDDPSTENKNDVSSGEKQNDNLPNIIQADNSSLNDNDSDAVPDSDYKGIIEKKKMDLYIIIISLGVVLFAACFIAFLCYKKKVGKKEKEI